ncbi:MAG: hypothetical protein WC982_09735 [Advenella sp.]
MDGEDVRIIVRTVGERTADECIRRASLEGDVDVISGCTPFFRVLEETYKLGSTYDQEWVPVVDGDVLLTEGKITAAVKVLSEMNGVFCLDGKTDDKILNMKRRAGIHIYRRDLMEAALQYVTESIKPETRARQAMELNHAARTYVGDIVFGLHDYEQYYRDLYRKAYLQVKKLGGKIGRVKKKYPMWAQNDDDYKAILAGHIAGTERRYKHVFDAAQYYGADDAIARLGLREKAPYETV